METQTISQYELERGKPVPRFKHALVQGNLIAALSSHRDRYSILPELDLELNGKPFVPDICVYPKRTVNWTAEEGPMTEPPLLSIEIISQSQTIDELIRRAEAYLAAGTKAAWVVVPSAQTIFVLTAECEN
ncbi:MAG: Uma2 family endonuclease [Chloroherpetonaceae bacterium]|nr:Uma2 family endonuclease [Chloroherpetonaceae bacterium]